MMEAAAVQMFSQPSKRKGDQKESTENVADKERTVLLETPMKHPYRTDTSKALRNMYIIPESSPEMSHMDTLQSVVFIAPPWALWFFKNKSKMWQNNLRLITKFDTVEDFWALYNNIQLASKLSSGCDYSVFKDGIEPMWEDQSNKCGGRWLITLSKQQRHSELDRFWLETLLCIIGEGFGHFSRDVCGAVINVRAKGDKIAIWTTNTENKEAVTYIGRKYKEDLGLPMKLIIGYQAHADTATKCNSITKNKFVV